MSTSKRYPRPFRWVHWITALIVGLMLIAGQRFGGEMSDADRIFSLTGHSSLGAIIVVLVLFRLACRFSGFATPPDLGLPRAQEMAARLVQWGIYGLLIWLPVTGILTARSHELPVKPFGAFDISTHNAASFDSLRMLHEWGTWALMALLALHIGAALMHAMKRDGVMGAMNPFAKRGS